MRRKQRSVRERPAGLGRRPRGPFVRAIQMPPERLPAQQRNGAEGLLNTQEAPRSRRARAARSRVGCVWAGKWRVGGKKYGEADANVGVAETLHAGKNGAGRSAADELKIERSEKQEKAEEKHFGGDHGAVGSSVDRLE